MRRFETPRMLRKTVSQASIPAPAPSPSRTLVLSPMASSFDLREKSSAHDPERIVEEEEMAEPLFRDAYISIEDDNLRQRFARPPSPPDIRQFITPDADDEEDEMEEDEEDLAQFGWEPSIQEMFVAKVVQIFKLSRPRLIDIAPRFSLKTIPKKERGHASNPSQSSTTSSSDAGTAHSSDMSRSPSVSSATTNSDKSKLSPASSIYEPQKPSDDAADKTSLHDDWAGTPITPCSDYCDQMFNGLSAEQETNHPFRRSAQHKSANSFSRPLQLNTHSFQLQNPPPKRTSSIYSAKQPPTPLSAGSSKAPSIDLAAYERRAGAFALTHTVTPPASPDVPNRKRAGGIWTKRGSFGAVLR